LGVAKFETAFAGFTNNTPWFLFGALIMGAAASGTGLAQRVGYLITGVMGTSYRRLLLSILVMVLLLNLLVPSGMAQVTILAPIVIGIVSAFGADNQSNIGRGMFVILTYTCGLFNKMILSGGGAILTRGMVEQLTGYAIPWSQYFIAFLPATLLTIAAAWITVQWLYPPEKTQIPRDSKYLKDREAALKSWTLPQKKTLSLMLIAISLWATDFLHHIDPAVIALGVGLALVLPGIGVLTAKDVRKIDLLLILFLGGALSMGEVLIQTKALDTLTGTMMSGMDPLMSGPYSIPAVLYWGGFLYHLVLGSELSMLSTALPVIINYAQAHHFNPTAFALLWAFASGGKIFVYQSAVLVLGYGYGFFKPIDLLKVGLVLTIIEGLILWLLVPLYWPLIGLSVTG
jgi:anion transporter